MDEFRFFKQFGTHVKTVPRKNSSQGGSVVSSNTFHSRERSKSQGINHEPLRMSMKSLNNNHKIHRHDDINEDDLI